MALTAIRRNGPELNRSAVRFARAIGFVVAVFGIGILAGWHLEAPLIADGLPPSLTITPNSAAGLLISALGLLALTHWSTRLIARILGLFLVLTAGIILSHEITGEHAYVDRFLFDWITEPGSGVPSPDISPGAKISFILLGSVLILTARTFFIFTVIVELLLAATLTLSITNLIGHSYEVTQNYNPFPFTEMPIHMGLILALLAAGFSAACPDRGFARALLDTSAGGQMIRRLLPGIIIIPILLGWGVHRGMIAGLYGSSVGIASFAVLTILILTGFSWLTSIALKHADADRDFAHQELQQQRESLRTILLSIADAVIVVDPDGRIVFMNPVAGKITGHDDEADGTRRVADVYVLKDEKTGVAIDDPSLQAIAEKENLALDEAVLERKDGTTIPIEFVSSPVLNRNGTVEGAVVIFRDITHRRQSEEQMNMLVRELNHRVRNVLMIVHSLVKASSEHVGQMSAEDVVGVILDRLRSLGRAHELLLDTHWTGANFKRMLVQELEPFRSQYPDKVKLQGKDVMLPPQCTSVVAMSIHELTTNAAKYGALSAEDGELSVSWSLRGSRLTINWVENNINFSDGVKPGFGTSLIKKGIEDNLGGEIKFNSDKDSLAVTLRIPLPSED